VIGWPERLIVVGAALAGLVGVALSAVAAHAAPGATLETAARFLLVHAPALAAVAALLAGSVVRLGLGRLAGLAMFLGLVLFCGDLTCRALLAAPLAPMAAPAGGILLMLGWALLGLAALLPRRST
jgi:uncharacterized membrane protein YgdD (TMEM256/DUF423 family)